MKVEERICPHCAGPIEGNEKFCTWCGSSLEYNGYTSGIQNAVSAQTCSYCRSNDIRIQVEPAGIEGYQKTVAVCRNCGYSWVVSSNLPGLNEDIKPQRAVTPYQSNVPPTYNYGQSNVPNANNDFGSSKDKTVTLVLCIFLGYFGAHHFYAGRYGMGILYLLTSGLCGVGWIIDIVMILTGSYKDGDGNPIV